jgi:hypothetical protein
VNLFPFPTPANYDTNRVRLTREFLDVGRLTGDERQWHDTRDVHLRTEDVHVEAELLADVLHVLETLLVVGAGTADPDLDLVLDELGGDLSQRANDTLEGRCDVGEVGNTTTDEQDLAFLVLGSTEHEVEDSAGIVEGLSLGGGTRVLTVVGELAGETGRGNGVGVDDGSTTTSNKGPDATRRVEDGKLERCTGLGVHLSNIGLLFAHLTAEGSRELHRWADIDGGLRILEGSKWCAESSRAAGNGPLCTALKLSSLIDLGCEIKEVNISRSALSVGDDNEGVDLEVAEEQVSNVRGDREENSRELAVNVDGV